MLPLAVAPSPKFQLKLAMVPSESVLPEPLNVKTVAVVPDVGLTVIAATGAWLEVPPPPPVAVVSKRYQVVAEMPRSLVTVSRTG